MAFESIVSYVILFSLGLSAVVGMSVMYKDYVTRTTFSLDTRQELLEQKAKSEVGIKNISYEDPSEEDFSISSEKDFSEGIFEDTNETMQPGNLTLDYNGSDYSERGNWTSPIYDLGHEANLTKISFSSDVPPSGWLGFQLRSAENSSQLIGEFFGPDGTKDTFYEISETDINLVHRGHKVFQARVFLNTSDTGLSPVLEELNVSYRFVYGSLVVNALNGGKVKLDKDYLDFFVNNLRVERNYDALSAHVVAETDLQNPGLWDPGEVLEISFPINLSQDKHVFRLVSEFSTSDYVAFES